MGLHGFVGGCALLRSAYPGKNKNVRANWDQLKNTTNVTYQHKGYVCEVSYIAILTLNCTT